MSGAGDVNGRCECCGQLLPNDPVAVKAAELADAARLAGMLVTFDNYINEGDAAALLGISEFTMRNRRLTDQPIPARKLGRRPQYSLHALAAFLVDGETDVW